MITPPMVGDVVVVSIPAADPPPPGWTLLRGRAGTAWRVWTADDHWPPELPLIGVGRPK